MNNNNIISQIATITDYGARQMAIDEGLLLAASEDHNPRFRFYYWEKPTISLGYFQDYHRFRSAFPQFADFDIVRRLTGGGAILHDIEITYCLLMPCESQLYIGGPIAAYTLVHNAISDALSTLGVDLELRARQENYNRVKSEPEFCFARPCPTDLICPAGKLVGSAQRRLKTAFMQHGSIILENRFSEQPTATLSDLVSGDLLPTRGEIEDIIIEYLAKSLSLDFQERNMNDYELSISKSLISKYESPEWTIDRTC